MPKPKNKKEKRGAGRPTDYLPEYAEHVKKLCLLGMIDVEIAAFFGVCEKTLNNWKGEHPEFLQSMVDGKEKADAEVACKLYERATGAEWTEEQAFKVKIGKDEERVQVVEVRRAAPPDTQAASLWLRNRQPQKWRDKQEQEHSGVVQIEDTPAGRLELARQLAFLLRSGKE